MAEGGVRNALIVSGPGVERAKGSINHGIMSVADIMPTLLEITGASYPETVNGSPPPPLIGKSWVGVLAGEEESPRSEQDYLAWELFGNRALRQGDWKIRWQWKPFGTGQWELFNLVEDAAERFDLAASQPSKLNALLKLWDEYALANNVIIASRSPWDTRSTVICNSPSPTWRPLATATQAIYSWMAFRFHCSMVGISLSREWGVWANSVKRCRRVCVKTSLAPLWSQTSYRVTKLLDLDFAVEIMHRGPRKILLVDKSFIETGACRGGK
jgi:hypothetical protein